MLGLHARLLDANGAPLAGCEVDALVSWASGAEEGEPEWRAARARCDENGRVRYDVPAPPAGASATLELRHWRVVPPGVPTYGRARVALGATATVGPVELGDLRLADPPLVMAGVIVDDAGVGGGGRRRARRCARAGLSRWRDA
ncbi:MAG: hypothetical protein QGI46_08090 [Planctomycetota bacterium]|nr:hypothetical protein [Planctomycetota bacterium]